ncbi:MAG: dTMP kinase [Candidatus Nealsonbacteria bacterium]|nr:MAG: dTMP kinase [Candidatus Nealsonbacteria bacterium]
MEKNTFLVFEGLDGAGGETQTKLLSNFLKKEKIPFEKLSYPDYRGPIGKLIHQFLHREYEFSPENQFLLYFSDFLKDKEKIKKWQQERKFIISDRYFTSTLAYQCQKGFPLKTALKIAELFDLPKPDLVIYLKISPETSIKRKFSEKRSLDRHEADKKFLKELTKSYQKLIKKQTFSRWIMIDGEKSIEEVFLQVKEIIINNLKL